MKSRFTFLFSFLLLVSGGAAEEKKQPEPTEFIRFAEDASGARLQTGIASYRNKAGVTVDLIGAIHVADKAYYEKLNERFQSYDALLYEMVGGPIEKREKRSNVSEASTEEQAEEMAEAAAAEKLSWLHSLYDRMQSSLELESQMAIVDYHRPNFVHADMTVVQFTTLQKERSESFLSLWWKAVQAQVDQPQQTSQPGLIKILEILCRKDSATELKRLIGRSFDEMESLMTGMETGDGTVILTERNKVALAAMEKQIAAGKKKLGIFYGAAHLPDMEKRLLEMGFTLQKSEWLTAWDLPPEPVKKNGKESTFDDKSSSPPTNQGELPKSS
ncbi:hypothetical protein BH11VER1_BH11VER1_32140 [soil metagenome]